MIGKWLARRHAAAETRILNTLYGSADSLRLSELLRVIDMRPARILHALERLEDRHLIAAAWEGGPYAWRRCYQLTETGRRSIEVDPR